MDLYNVLGVERTANQDQIKRAYRKLASQHHPDKGGDTAKFQQIQSAYEVLSDPQRRADYDTPRPQGPAFSFDVNGFDFGQIFGGFNQRFAQSHPRRNHLRMSLWVSLYDVAMGAKRAVNIGTTSGVSTVEIEIPLGINDGDNVQYAEIAPGGHDLVVQFRISPDNKWSRQDLNLFTEHTVTIWQLILGGTAKITDIYQTELELKIPPMTQPGTLLRLKDRGLRNRHHQQGDALVKLNSIIPPNIHPDVISAVQKHHQ